MIILAMFAVGAVLVVPLLLIGLRRWMLDEEQREAWLRSPRTHRLVYEVPNGQDASVVAAALAHAGFMTVVETCGGRERFIIACEESDVVRAQGIAAHAIHAG